MVREIFRQLPQESVLYLGDTARVPYGPRGLDTIQRFSRELAEFLLARAVKALVIACNTVSATAADAIREISPVPVFDVVQPTVRTAVAATRSRRIGIIGTVSTVRSDVYGRLAAALDPEVQVIGQPCPLFVPIAEENLQSHPVARMMADEYLRCFAGTGIDTLILGCTHYPLLSDVIAESVSKVVGGPVHLVDSAEPTVGELAAFLSAEGKLADGPPLHRFFVTDSSYRFMQIAASILGRDVAAAVAEARLVR